MKRLAQLLTLFLTLLTHPLWGSPFGADWSQTDFSKKNVDLAQIQSGGPGKDGIPAIDHPHFVSPDQARQWLHDKEPVIALVLGDDARAYPLQILIWHEIVNDVVQGQPVMVTFCPLCNAAMSFKRTLKNKVYDFGVSGLLRHSDMVMYDRQTHSWWQQFTGTGIVGTHTGTQLHTLPSPIISFAHFYKAHPEGKVLSRQTGHSRQYGHNPYRGYDRIGNDPFLLEGDADPRLPAMERVLGLSDGQQMHRIYPFQFLQEHPLFQDQFQETPLVIFSRMGTLSALDAGKIHQGREILQAAAYDRRLKDHGTLDFIQHQGEILDKQTRSHWNLLGQAVSGPLRGQRLSQKDQGVHFAFAWLVFRPSSEIKQP
ncbi:DUF3179 domain-containing protein [Magnetococcus sp. PR-3]|uniref:DUF3179 domain-containing protein n=1 Tax=Magnetococcus sp. PR-3 TaxID=3120355 RepID=UPI002FCE4100